MGLHYNRFRSYDPESGRYASPDPLGVTPAPNPVAYVGNRHRLTDPLGLSPCHRAMDCMEDNRIPAGDPVTHGPTDAGQLVDAVTNIPTTMVDLSGSWCATRVRTIPGSPSASPT